MSLTCRLPNGQRVSVEGTAVTIGRHSEADILVLSMDVQPIHARIVKVAGRWIVESAGDWLLQVGDGVPGRKLWLRSDDVLYLTDSGISLTFESEAPSKSESPVGSSGLAESSPSAEDFSDLANGDSPLPGLLGHFIAEDEDSPPLLLADVPPLPLPSASSLDLVSQTSAPEAHSAPPVIAFRGRGTILVGKGTVTFTGQRPTAIGEMKPGSLIVPLDDVDLVSRNEKRVDVSIRHDNAAMPLTFDATTAEEAKRLAAALERDELSEMQRKRTEASGRPVLIDHSPPRCFTVTYTSSPPK